MKTKDLITGALLSALSLVIPLAFGQTLSITIPPFSATLASHMPIMLAFTLNPFIAVMVGLVSAFGFLITKGPIIAARALIHALFGFTGAKLMQRGVSFKKALLITAPIHAIGEALIVLPFGYSLYQGLIIVGIGTLIHHFIDSAITLAVQKTLSKTGQLVLSK